MYFNVVFFHVCWLSLHGIIFPLRTEVVGPFLGLSLVFVLRYLYAWFTVPSLGGHAAFSVVCMLFVLIITNFILKMDYGYRDWFCFFDIRILDDVFSEKPLFTYCLFTMNHLQFYFKSYTATQYEYRSFTMVKRKNVRYKFISLLYDLCHSRPTAKT